MSRMKASVLAAVLGLLACAGTHAAETKAVGVAVPAEAANDACTPATASAPAPEAARDSMPARISTNVTVPKQTQGASFGEKVNQGLHASGGAVAQGAATTGAAEPGAGVVSSRCAKLPDPEPMTTPESTEK